MHTTSPIKIATAITAAARRVQRRIATLASFPPAAEDSDRSAAERDEIEHTTVDTCDACEARPKFGWSDPTAACSRSASTPPPARSANAPRDAGTAHTRADARRNRRARPRAAPRRPQPGQDIRQKGDRDHARHRRNQPLRTEADASSRRCSAAPTRSRRCTTSSPTPPTSPVTEASTRSPTRLTAGWRRRARGALQQLRAKGAARRLQRSVWMIDRPAPATRRMLLVSLHGAVADVELRVSDAIDLLRGLDEPADLVLCDPPFGLGRRGQDDLLNGQGRVYRRDQDRVVTGYQESPKACTGGSRPTG